MAERKTYMNELIANLLISDKEVMDEIKALFEEPLLDNSATQSATYPDTSDAHLTIDLNNEWVVGESVKDWLERRIIAKQYSFETLQKLTGLSRFTLDKLKKSDEYYISTPITEQKLSKVLGNYGYPSPLQMLLRQTDIESEKCEEGREVSQHIIKSIIELEQKKISILRTDIPWLESHIVRKWLHELQKKSDIICQSLSEDYKCSINKNSIRIALVDGASRLARHLNLHDDNFANKLKASIEKNFFIEMERISQDIFHCSVKRSTVIALLALEESHLELKDWDLNNAVISKETQGILNSYYECESNLYDIKKNDFFTQYNKCAYSDVECELCSPELELFINPRLLYSENYVLDEIVSLNIPKSLEELKDFNIVHSNEMLSSKLIFIGSHFDKRYGAIQPFASRTFNVGMYVCKACADEYIDYFLSPLSLFIRNIRKKWLLGQQGIALELGVNQGIVSKIENEKIRFIEPNIMLKIWGLYKFGTLEKNRLFSNVDNSLVNKLRMSGFEDKHMQFNKKLKVKTGRFIGKAKGADPLLEIKCDLFVTNDSETIKIACFNFCRRVREVYFCLAISKNLGATHMIINGDICLDIRLSEIKQCELPFNMSIICVRSIAEKEKYCEMDKAIINTYIRDCDIDSFAMGSFSSENELTLSQSAFEASISLENEDDLEYELSSDVLSEEDHRFLNSDRLSEFFYKHSRRNYFRLHSYHYRTTDYWSLDELLIPNGYGHFTSMYNLACNFQKEIVKSIEDREKTIEEISEIYNVHVEVIEMWVKNQ